MLVSLRAAKPGRHQTLLILISISLALWAEWALFTRKLAVDGIILFAIALVVFVGAVLRDQRLVIAAEPVGAATKRAPLDRVALAACVFFAALTFLLATGNRFTPDSVFAWILSVVFYVRAFWLRPAGPSMTIADRFRSVRQSGVAISWPLVGLGLVLIVAAFFRYYQIGAIPPEPTSDHAEKLLDVRDVLNGQFSIFFPRNTGREAIQFYMAVPFVQFFGLTHMALKVEQATVSLLAIPLVFLIGKEIGGARYGLLAAFFLAISKWDVAIARVGLRFPLYPFFVALALYFLLRGMRRGSRNDFLICGLVTGLGMYGYSPFRAAGLLIPVLIAITIAYGAKSGRPAVRTQLQGAAVWAGGAFLVFIPLLRYMTEHPDMFWFRALSRMAGAEAPLPPSPAGVFLSNVANALLMFNWRGDVVWVNTVPFDPVLDWVSGGLFILGLAWCIHSLVRHREPVAAYLLVSIPILLLPSILSLSFPGENPSVVRTGGATPIVALIVAAPVYLGGVKIAGSWKGKWGTLIALIAVAFVLGLAAKTSYDRYFTAYPVQYRESAVNSTEMAAVINGFTQSVGSQQNAYIKSYPYWVDTRNIAIEIGNPAWNNVLMTTDDVTKHQPPPGNKLYIINKDDKEAVAAFQRRFPNGQLRTQPSLTPGKDFLVFFVPAER